MKVILRALAVAVVAVVVCSLLLSSGYNLLAMALPMGQTFAPGQARNTPSSRMSTSAAPVIAFVTQDGVKRTFHQGTAYRYPGMVPMIEVVGDYYEMGLQYGVLLQPEILSSMNSWGTVLSALARSMGVPPDDLYEMLKGQAAHIARGLPQKYVDEMQGVADGAGIPFEKVQTYCLFYDTLMSFACTGVLMRGPGGTIIQGRNQDTAGFGGEEIPRMCVIVRNKAPGCNAVTHFDWVLFMGVETGYNDKGLAFAEETYNISAPNTNGVSLVYMVREAMERCSSLEELYTFLDEVYAAPDRHGTIGAYGAVWSDRDEGRGVVTELTPTAWRKWELGDSVPPEMGDGNILWNFNRIYHPDLVDQQSVGTTIGAGNYDREAIAATFPRKKNYSVKDALNFLGLQIGPDGTDYSWSGSRTPICNSSASQALVFDPKGNGVYFANSVGYSARRDIYHIHDDFSRPPDLFQKGTPPSMLVEYVARIKNSLASPAQQLDAYLALAKQFATDANMQFIVALNSFQQDRWDLFVEYAGKAYDLDQSTAEYKLYAGFGAFKQKNNRDATALLNGVDTSKLSIVQELHRLGVLERADPDNAAEYANQRQAILDQYGAEGYYTAVILPKIDKLSE